MLIITSVCWEKAGLNANPSVQLKPLDSGARLERKYDGGADPNQGGSCQDGWWLLMNTSETDDVKITKADANFGLRLPGGNPRDK